MDDDLLFPEEEEEELEESTVFNYLEKKNKRGEVFHDAINQVLAFVTYGKNTHIPHEWYFIKVLTDEILKNNKLAEEFIMYGIQYYPTYQWLDFNPNDYLTTALLECALQQFQYQQKHEFDLEDDNPNVMTQAMAFGDMATDFLIRHYGYSLIKSSNQKIILTAQSDCHKRFEKLLSKGYSLQRRQKAGYIEIEKLPVDPNNHQGIKGVFYKLPILPTRDIGYPIDEIIELPNGQYEKVYQKN